MCLNRPRSQSPISGKGWLDDGEPVSARVSVRVAVTQRRPIAFRSSTQQRVYQKRVASKLVFDNRILKQPNKILFKLCEGRARGRSVDVRAASERCGGAGGRRFAVSGSASRQGGRRRCLVEVPARPTC